MGKKYSSLNHPNTLKTICYLIDYQRAEIVFDASLRRVFFFFEDFRFLTCKKMSWNINAVLRDLLHLHKKSENCSGRECRDATREKRLIDILPRSDPHEKGNLYWIKNLL